MRLFAEMATASYHAAVGDETSAADVLRSSSTHLPLQQWPERAHLLGLPLVYLVLPESRAVLDRIALGSSLAVAVRAGQALVALRGAGSVVEAAELPWSNPDLLRVHVLPIHLAELSAAAASSGVAEADDVLGSIPDQAALLRSLAVRSDGPASTWARLAWRRRPVILVSR